jgi:hypothetical protein
MTSGIDGAVHPSDPSRRHIRADVGDHLSRFRVLVLAK